MSEIPRRLSLVKAFISATSRRLLRVSRWILPQCWLGDWLYTVIRFRRALGVWPNLWRPETFSEHINRKKLYDRDPRLTMLADKYAVRQYVCDRVGDGYLTQLYQVTDNPEEIDFTMLPDRFVIKTTHGSGWNVLVTDRSAADEAAIRERLRYWLGQNYYRLGREWCYKNVQPRLIVEEFLGSDGQSPWDYKFFCFDGIARFVQVDFDRFGKHTRNLYDRSWKLLGASLHFPASPYHPDRPSSFQEMVRVAEKLADGLDFVRVDLYDTSRGVYFGELTHYPGNGFEKFTPTEFDAVFGAWWPVHKRHCRGN